MKTIILYIVGAVITEFAIIAIATMMGLSGMTMIVATALLPVALIAATIYYFYTRVFRGEAKGEENEGGEADK